MSIKTRLLSGSIWVVFGRFSMLIAAFLINVLLARILDTENLGIYFLMVSLVNILSVIGLLGMNRLVVRLIPEKLSSPVPSAVKVIIKKSAIISTVGLLIAMAAYWFGLQDWLNTNIFRVSNLEGLGVFIVLWLFLWGAQTFTSEVLRGFHDIRGATIHGGLLYNLVFVSGLFTLWLTSSEISLQMILILLNGALLLNLALVFVSIYLHQSKIKATNEHSGNDPILGSALYLLLTSISLLLINDVHLWIIGFFQDETEVAQYGAAFRLINLLILPLTMINMLIPSTVSQLFFEKRRAKLRWLMSTSAVVAGVPTVIALTFVLGWGDSLLNIVYGEQYLAAAPVLFVLAVGHIINAATGSPGVLLMMTGNEKQVMKFSVGSAICGIVVSLYLTPKLGALGAAFGTALTVVIHNVSMWFYTVRKLGINTRLKLTSITDLYQRIRLEIEVRANDSKFMEVVERFIRIIESAIWKIQGVKIIDCFGDSHSRVFRMLNGHQLLPNYRFRVVAVRGATIFGLANPNSKTNSLNIFKAWLKLSPEDRTVAFMLGEVDMGFLIWWRAKKYGIDSLDAFNEAVNRYQDFLITVMTTHKNIIIVAAPLPTIPDGFTEGEVAGARGEINASQLERTSATLKFNNIMKEWCNSMNLKFVDMDHYSLNIKTKLVRSSLLNENSGDHHYNQIAFVNVLAESFVHSRVLED